MKFNLDEAARYPAINVAQPGRNKIGLVIKK